LNTSSVRSEVFERDLRHLKYYDEGPDYIGGQMDNENDVDYEYEETDDEADKEYEYRHVGIKKFNKSYDTRQNRKNKFNKECSTGGSKHARKEKASSKAILRQETLPPKKRKTYKNEWSKRLRSRRC